MESDLHPKSSKNMLFKYADDTTLIVPENTDVSRGFLTGFASVSK